MKFEQYLYYLKQINMEKTLIVTAEGVKHQDVTGKDVWYIKLVAKIGDQTELKIIKSGESTFEWFEHLKKQANEKPKEPELPFKEGAEGNNDNKQTVSLEDNNTLRGRGDSGNVIKKGIRN